MCIAVIDARNATGDTTQMIDRPTAIARLARLGAALALAAMALMAAPARAEVALLVPGFLGNGDAWRSPGVTDALTRGGWTDGGTLRSDSARVYVSAPHIRAARHFYTVALPNASSLARQLPVLARYVDFVRSRHAGESLYLLAHSAGGVLARLYMVEHPHIPIAGLVTVASPHLGTETAEIASLLSESLVAAIPPYLEMLGLAESLALYRELARERPGSYLYRLNRREHPPSRYVSVVRRKRPGWPGDILVPARSQDMNAVFALHGRASVVYHGEQHGLQPDDGPLLARILKRLQSA